MEAGAVGVAEARTAEAGAGGGAGSGAQGEDGGSTFLLAGDSAPSPSLYVVAPSLYVVF